MEVWREDVALASERLDVAALADRVVARAGREPRLAVAPATARRYAAAALILLGLGIGGTVLTRSKTAGSSHAPRWRVFEEELVDVIANDPRYAPSLGEPASDSEGK